MESEDQEAYRFVIDGFLKECPRLAPMVRHVPPAEFNENFCVYHKIDGRCTDSRIYLRPNCDHLTMAHEISHFVLLSTVKERYMALGEILLDDKIYPHTVSGREDETLSILSELNELTSKSVEIVAAKKSVAHGDLLTLSAFTRTDEALANCLAQYVASKTFPSELEFLENCEANSLKTDGYWTESTFTQISPLLDRLCK